MLNVPPKPRKKRRAAVCMNHVSTRLDVPTIDRLDALVPVLTSIGSLPARSIAVRAVILAGLQVLEEQYADKLPKR